MQLVNKMALKLKPSETMAVKARALALKAEGKSIVDLCAGEPDIDTPDFIKEAALKALKDGKTKYTNSSGIPELREAIAEKLHKENLINVKPSQVIVTNGGKQALHHLFQVVLDPGDEVIIPSPYWVSYPPMVELAGGKSVIVPTAASNGYKMSAEALSKAITPKTRCVIINSPSNPTGAGYTKSELAALGAVIVKSSSLVVSDEVYEKICYGGFKFASFVEACPDLAERTVTVNAFSKSYSMTGWRVGYAAGPAQIINAMGNYQTQSTSNVNSIAQYAAVAALKGPQDFLIPMVNSFSRRIDLALEIISKTSGLSVPVRPEGAFYLFVRFDELKAKLCTKGIKSSTDFINFLLEQAGVASVAGEAFGDDGAFRISVSASDNDVKEGLSRIKTVLEAFN